MQINIPNGSYSLNAGMSLKVAEDLTIHEGCRYAICGANGSGKSSFVRNILFHHIQKQCKGTVQYLYFDQEIASQYYYTKAYFSYKEHRKINNVSDFIFLTLDLHLRQNIYTSDKFILVLDETDKYVPTEKVLDRFSSHSLTMFNVSHRGDGATTYSHHINIIRENETHAVLQVS
ncbi:ATP-binding cassette domain-containing protein [Chitinophaga lutea]